MKAEEVVPRLQSEFPSAVHSVAVRPGVLARLEVDPGSIVPIARWLRDEATFCHCSMVGGVDWVERREVLYLLWSDELRTYLEISAWVPGEDPHIDSVSGVWRGAIWHERETWDLVGIRFVGHPDLRRVFLPEGYEFHPLLKSMELHEPEELEVKRRHV